PARPRHGLQQAGARVKGKRRCPGKVERTQNASVGSVDDTTRLGRVSQPLPVVSTTLENWTVATLEE
ncbi:MAG TPA: hypothetical protein VIY28_13800, partial [Pseudonocardiaceae bacterium]